MKKKAVILILFNAIICVGCRNVEQRIDEKFDVLRTKASQLDSIVNLEVRKVQHLDTIINQEMKKIQYLDSIIKAESNKINSVLNLQKR